MARIVTLSLDEEAYGVWMSFKRGSRSRFIRSALKRAKGIEEDYSDSEILGERVVKLEAAIKRLLLSQRQGQRLGLEEVEAIEELLR